MSNKVNLAQIVSRVKVALVLACIFNGCLLSLVIVCNRNSRSILNICKVDIVVWPKPSLSKEPNIDSALLTTTPSQSTQIQRGLITDYFSFRVNAHLHIMLSLKCQRNASNRHESYYAHLEIFLAKFPRTPLNTRLI